MKTLSLFSGIGGMDLGLERAGFEIVAQCEQDPFCRAVLAKHWPGVPCFDDVRTIDPSSVGPVDCVCGGFPCQDVSVAGKGAGVDAGERSGLWREMFRVIDALRPRWVIAENVPALRTRGADRVLGDLEGIGYACWPLVVGAHHVGAPHRRDRVFVVAHSQGFGRDCSSFENAGRRSEIDRKNAKVPARPAGGRTGIGGRAWWIHQPDMDRVVYGIPDGMDNRTRSLGRAVVPQVAEVVGAAVMAAQLGGVA